MRNKNKGEREKRKQSILSFSCVCSSSLFLLRLLLFSLLAPPLYSFVFLVIVFFFVCAIDCKIA